MPSTYELLAQGLISHLGLDPTLVRPEATFTELYVDSLSMAELVLILEEDHGLDTKGIDPHGTPADAAAHLEQVGSSKFVADERIPADGRS
jgi:acyl carrier protein